MGRFYKTSKAEFVDGNIYMPPVELMAKVIGNADTQIEKNETALVSFYKDLEAKGLQADEPRLKEIINNYKTMIDDKAKQIQSDPLAFRKEMSNIKKIGSDIKDNWTNGEVAAIQGNYSIREKFVKDQLEKTKKEKGYVTQDDVTFATNKFDREFKGTNYKGPGDYEQYKKEDLNAFVNLEEISEDRAKGYLADVITTNGAYTDGKYMYTSENKKEIVPYDTVKKGVLSSMLNDRELMAYYGQQVRLGRFTQEEVAEKMQSAADRVAEKYSYRKDESGRKSITGDPFKLQRDQFDNQWKLRMEDKKDAIIAGPAVDANIRTGEQLDIINKDFGNSLRALASNLGVKSKTGRLSPSDVRTKIKTLQRLAKTPEQKKAVEKYANQLNSITDQFNSGKVKASWSGFASVYGTDVTAKAQKGLTEFTKDARNVYDKKMDYKINGRKFKDVTLYDIYANPSKYGLKKDAFTIADPDAIEGDVLKKRDIKEVFVQGSQVPVMVSDRPEDWQYNDMIFEFEGDNINIEGQTSFGNIGIDYVK